MSSSGCADEFPASRSMTGRGRVKAPKSSHWSYPHETSIPAPGPTRPSTLPLLSACGAAVHGGARDGARVRSWLSASPIGARSSRPIAMECLFEEATGRPGRSPLNDEDRDGTYVCAACRLPCSRAPISITAAAAGRVSPSRSPTAWARRRTTRSSRVAGSTIAFAAASIRGMSSRTVPRRRASVNATTGWRCRS